MRGKEQFDIVLGWKNVQCMHQKPTVQTYIMEVLVSHIHTVNLKHSTCSDKNLLPGHFEGKMQEQTGKLSKSAMKGQARNYGVRFNTTPQNVIKLTGYGGSTYGKNRY